MGFFPESKYADGKQVAQVAIDNEFGHINDNGSIVPPRPFLHPTYLEQKSKWLEVLQKSIKNQGESISVKKSLEDVGFVAQQDVQDKIDWWASSGIPRNAPATIRMKAGSRHGEKEESGRAVGDSPLIWSGHMRESVEFKVTSK